MNNNKIVSQGGSNTMYQNLKKKSEGFTIIEVLIVLAIAGLIMLIVFLAVPALQRNSRNTQRRNDVSKVLSVVTEYSNNNNGAVPTNAVCYPQAVILGPTGTQAAGIEMGHYCKGVNSLSWNNGATNNTATVDTIVMRSGAVCDGTTGNATTTGATARSVVAMYRLEPNTPQCQAT